MYNLILLVFLAVVVIFLVLQLIFSRIVRLLTSVSVDKLAPTCPLELVRIDSATSRTAVNTDSQCELTASAADFGRSGAVVAAYDGENNPLPIALPPHSSAEPVRVLCLDPDSLPASHDSTACRLEAEVASSSGSQRSGDRLPICDQSTGIFDNHGASGPRRHRRSQAADACPGSASRDGDPSAPAETEGGNDSAEQSSSESNSSVNDCGSRERHRAARSTVVTLGPDSRARTRGRCDRAPTAPPAYAEDNIDFESYNGKDAEEDVEIEAGDAKPPVYHL